MKRSRKLMLTLQACALAMAVTAQSADSTRQRKAENILALVSQAVDNDSSIVSDFHVISKKTDGSTDTLLCRIYTKKKKMLLVQTDRHGNTMECYFDGNTEVYYTPRFNNAFVDSTPGKTTSPGSNMLDPRELFTVYKGFHKSLLIKEDTLNGIPVARINLYPDNPQTVDYHTVQLTVDRNKNLVTGIVFDKKDGSSINYIFNSFSINAGVADAVFRFDPSQHPGVKIMTH